MNAALVNFLRRKAVFFVFVFTHTKHKHHHHHSTAATMATTITMKLIMAFFVLMNFSGLVITLTSPKVMSNDNNNNYEAVGPFAPLRLPYNSTSNIYAKPSQAVRATTMKQLPRPTTIHFFERSQQGRTLS
jgi:hypothetical protein